MKLIQKQLKTHLLIVGVNLLQLQVLFDQQHVVRIQFCFESLKVEIDFSPQDMPFKVAYILA